MLLASWIAAVLVPVMAEPVDAAVPDGFSDETVISGLANPTVVRFSPDGRVFVAEKSGIIKVYDSLDAGSPEIFADLRTQVYNYWDRGLLGLALHPQFPSDPRVYVLYTYDAPPGETAPYWGEPGQTSDPCPDPPGATADGCVVQGHLSVLRAVAGQNVSDGTEQVLIEDWCQQYPSHSMGTVDFGPDGMLYASAGEGASFSTVDYGQRGSPVNPCGDPPGGVGGSMAPPSAEGGALRSQDALTMPADPGSDPLTLDGAIIRVDPDTGDGLGDNPLAGTSSDPNASRLIAHGLRNPFRFDFRPGTDELWSGDVGWNTYEEINRIADVNDTSMENFGWPCYEGPNRQAGYDGANLTLCEGLYGGAGHDAPHYAYHHNDQIVSENPCPTGGSSEAGVAFYEGGSYPPEYDGALIAADYSRDCIWVMPPGGDGVPDPSQRQRFVVGALNPVHLEIGPGGDLFYVNFNGGTIQRVVYSAGNQPPIAAIDATPVEGNAPLDVSFDATGSSDPEGEPLSFAWDLDGDGSFDDGTGAQIAWTYTEGGTYDASVEVSDAEGATDTASVVITVDNTSPVASIDSPSSSLTWAVGDPISFSGSATDAEDGSLPAAALGWSLILHHCDTPTTCHEHPIQDFPGTAGGSIVAPDHDFPSFLELQLTATDSGGLTDVASVELQPATVDLTFDTQPSGLDVALNGDVDTTPFTREVIVNSANTITAPTPQVQGGTSYEFSTWSDGGAASHGITAPSTPTTYAATFADSSDELPVVTPGGGRVTEGDPDNPNLTMSVRLSEASSEPVTAEWQTYTHAGSLPSATPSEDFEPSTGIVTFAPGETEASVQVPVIDDDEYERIEYVAVGFHNPTNARIGGFYGLGFGAIEDDDAPVVQPGAVAVSEGNEGVTIAMLPVALSEPSEASVTVEWSTLNGTEVSDGLADRESDFNADAGEITFAPGETATLIEVEIRGDEDPEPDEWLLIRFSNPVNAQLAPSWSGIGWIAILNDDGA